MRLSIDGSDSMKIEHGDHPPLIWSVKVFTTTQYKHLADPYQIVNEFLTKQSPAGQEALWDVYVQIHHALSTINDSLTLTATLTKLTADLYRQVDQSAVMHFVGYYASVRYPETCILEHIPDDPCPEKTYLRNDYTGLVFLTIALRLMLPVWGEYIALTQNETGSKHKEYYAFRLLQRSYLMSSAPMMRLLAYITAHSANKIDGPVFALNNLSTSQVPEWLLAIICIRRLAIGEIDHDDKGNLITNIHGFMRTTLEGVSRKFGMLTDRKPQGRDNEEEKSKLEASKIRQRIPPGQITLFEVMCNRPLELARSVDPTVPEDFVSACLAFRDKYTDMVINPAQITLAQWVLHTAMSPKALECITTGPMINALIATQALLWHWGFSDLALLAIAREVPRNNSTIRESEDNRLRQVKAALYDDLVTLFPYTTAAPTTGRGGNMGHDAVCLIAKDFINTVWRVTIPKRMGGITEGLIDRAGRMITPPTIAEQLAQLIIRTNLENDLE